MLFYRIFFISVILLTVALTGFAAEFSNEADLLNARYQRVNRLLRDGKLDEALLQADKALGMARKMYGAGAPGTAPAIDRIAAVYRAMGRFPEAQALLRQALEIVRKELGDNHYYTVSAMSNLAGIHKEMGQYGDAEQLYLRAMAIQKALPETTIDDEIGMLNNLAVLYMNIARYSDAEPLLVKALQLAEKAAEVDWLDKRMNISTDKRQLELANRMMNLASLYFKMKRYADAESLTIKALDIYKRILSEDHPEVARAKNNLGDLYSATGQYAKAERLLTEAVNNALKVYGDKPHPVVADYYTSLALLYQRAGNYADALPFARFALDIFIRTLGKENPKTLRCMNNLAVLHIYLGNKAEAELILRETLDTAKRTVGESHESVATNMANLGNVYAAQGRHKEAQEMYSGALRIDERKRDDAFLILSEQQKLNYISIMLLQVQTYLSHTLQHANSDERAVTRALNTWLRWKGTVMEAQGRYVDALYRSDDPLLQKRFDELALVKRTLARMLLSGGEEKNLQEQGRVVREMEKRKDALEAELSGLSREFALEKVIGKIDAGKISEVLPNDSVYIDFAEIAMADFTRLEPEKPRYVAFILVPGRKYSVILADIADKETLDALVRGYLDEMRKKAEARPEHDQKRLDSYASELSDLVFKPLIPHLQGRKNLYVSPDGMLHLIPFEVLKDQGGKYIAEEYRINYIASGRDLVRNAHAGDTAKGDAVIFADPDFDMSKSGVGKTVSTANVAGQSLRGSLANDFKLVHFDRLPDTKQEADSIERILTASGVRVKSYQGDKAIEAALFSNQNPKVLHLATHGYFLRDDMNAGAATRGLKVMLKESGKGDWNADLENPMLRSGFVLAGANSSLREGLDDGLVSAEKILGLRLRGTDLVTLSACETAVGAVRTGEGVYGLKRAFLLSGAKTLVMSLWSVPSAETTELMTEFYSQMANGKHKAQALHEAKLKMMKQKPHPFYWGAFIMVGKPD